MKIIIAIDLQNDFITGSLGTPEAKEICNKIIEYFNTLSKKDNYVVFTRDTHFNNYLDTAEGQKLPIRHCIKNTEGWEIASSIWDNCCIRKETICKQTFGMYDLPAVISDIDLDFALLEEQIDEIEIFGLCTDICVISNALILKSCFPEMKISVRANLCAGTTPEAHEAALKVMKSCQINIVED